MTVPPGAGTGKVVVTTASNPTQPYTSADTYSVTPTITNVSPGTADAGAFVGIDGTGFSGVTSVTFGGVPATFTVLPGHQHIDARVPLSATTGTLTVTTAGGSASWSSPFTVPPRVTTFTPTHGVATLGAATGTVVTIKGAGFRTIGGTQPTVKFNGTSADPSTVTVVSPNTITAVVPAGATSGKIVVSDADGTSAPSAASFALQPRIISLSTDHGPVGTVVTITGTSLTGATAVKFNGVAATTYTVNSDTQITATVPDDATTGLVTVVTPGGHGGLRDRVQGHARDHGHHARRRADRRPRDDHRHHLQRRHRRELQRRLLGLHGRQPGHDPGDRPGHGDLRPDHGHDAGRQRELDRLLAAAEDPQLLADEAARPARR